MYPKFELKEVITIVCIAAAIPTLFSLIAIIALCQLFSIKSQLRRIADILSSRGVVAVSASPVVAPANPTTTLNS